MPGLYGTVRVSNLNIENDVDILYYYRPTRSTDPDNMTGYKMVSSSDVTSWLTKATYDNNEGQPLNDILGLYELRLPVDIFNKKGFYSVYIRPKEIRTVLTDVSVLATYPDVKGVVLNLGSNELRNITDLTGYRIDYLDVNENRTDISRLITSCNRCEPVLVTVSDAYPKTTRYKFTDSSSNLVFCTVTPASASSFRPNVTPYIGVPGGSVYITNTKFDPKLVEIEMVDHDADTLTYMIAGDQVRNRDKAIITTFNDDHEIYKQQDYYTVKDSLGNALYDVKREREAIDDSESYDNTIDNI